MIQVAPGFRMELVASDPAVQDPIAISFDEDGRLFVVEMRGFMPNIDREGEFDETGRISLLEDKDGDGRYEKATVFLDKLVLPRSIAAVNGGILYVSAAKLWFAKDTNGDGNADRIELVDPTYAAVGNVEHAPNGLMRGMDNWIYSANSQYRYRWVDGVWIKQRTEFRGQWGITQDNFGRLYFNVNYSQLLGDITPPNYIGRNAHHKTAAGLNLAVSTNQHVFTIRMNTSVNRGYRTNVLDRTGRLYEFSGSCSPMIYRGDNYPAEFQGDAFVCDPSANLVKRNIVFDRGLSLASKFAYDNFEFIASTDERFRPVNIFNGPDGTLWVVDMYRGIIQYGTFMTSYLRRDILARGLETPINLGRVFRVVSTGKEPAKALHLSEENSVALVRRFSHPNGWVRDTAQRLLVERGDRSVVPDLIRTALKDSNPLARVHALWALEGLWLTLSKNISDPQSPSSTGPPPKDESHTPTPTQARLVSVEKDFILQAPSLTDERFGELLKALADPHPKVRVSAIRVLESISAGHSSRQIFLLNALNKPTETVDSEVGFQIALTAGNLPKPGALPLLHRIVTHGSENSLIRDAVLSGLQDWELYFLQGLLADERLRMKQPGRESLLRALASAIIKEHEGKKIEALLGAIGKELGENSWRQRSLLDGIAANALNRSYEPVSLSAAPDALVSLEKTDDSKLRDEIGQIENMFAWPGHQALSRNSGRSSARPLTQREEMALTEGKLYYQQICAGCHGVNGEGIEPVAPPLANSNWVLGPENRLIRIVLQGLEGPVHVNGTHYEPPTILPEMPSLATLDDVSLTAVLNYIRRDWGHEADLLQFGQVARVRRETANRETQWTEEELLPIK